MLGGHISGESVREHCWGDDHRAAASEGLALIGVLPSIVAEVVYDLKARKERKHEEGSMIGGHISGESVREHCWGADHRSTASEGWPCSASCPALLRMWPMICSVMEAEKHRGFSRGSSAAILPTPAFVLKELISLQSPKGMQG
jgi:hypothetical protein